MRLKNILCIFALLLTAVTGAWADDGIYCTASDVGRVVCTDGSIYDNVSAAEADGKTAVAMIAYLDTENNKGLALALADESDWMAWSTAISTCSAKTPTVTGGTWKLATKDEWDLMISAAGSYNALHDGFSSVGGTNMQWSSTYYYWSSTEYDSGRAWNYNFSGGSWYSDLKENCNYVRACLAFDFNAPVTKMADNWYMISRQTQTRQSDWTALSAGSTTGRTLGSADAVTYYYATGDLSFTNSTVGGSGLTIQGTVYLYIPSGTTLTCTGANASGQTGAGAGIELTQGNSLYLIGGGTLNANGGNAANGGNGGNGNNAECTYDESILGGSGGNGGNGGGGAGAGIGTRGGNGGNGGTGGQRNGSYGQETTQKGVDGNAGGAGNTADAMGSLFVANDLTVNAQGGAAGSNGTGGNRGLTASQHPGSNVYMASGGGGGGAGGFGGAANNIGTGGPGGGGGGGGAAGNVAWVVYSGTDNGYYHAGAKGGKGGTNSNGTLAPDGTSIELDNPKHADIQAGGLRPNASDYDDDDGWEKENGCHEGGSGGAAGSFVTSNIVTSTTTTLTSGLYYVISDVTVTERIQVSGDVTLNLSEGVTLTPKKGIEVSNGNSLTINGPGALTIDGCDRHKSGIGADAYGYITINGGTVNVTGGSGGAGIGGDRHNRSGQAITINGGVVNVQGGSFAAGIGAGAGKGNDSDPDYWGTCGHIYICGGQVTAIGGVDGTGDISGAGIGAGSSFNQPATGTLTLGWTNPDDFIYSSGYISEPSSPFKRRLANIYFVEGKQFIIEGTATIATKDNIGGKKIVPYSAEQVPLSGAGTQDNPWRITSTADWNALAQNVINNNSYSGKFVQLEADIIITRGVGVSDRSFSGTFLGNGHTITADLTTYNSSVAPFNNISDATIKNLTVAGTITTNQRHSSALAAYASGTNVIESCIVTATINTSTDYTGGFIGHGLTSATTIRGCIFAGTVNGVDGSRPNVGIFWGWSDSGTPALENCLEKGNYTNLSSMHPMGLQAGSGTINNCYYVTPQIGSPSNACTVSGARQAYALATTPANLGDLVQDYGLAKVYQNGVLYDGTYYVIPVPLAGSGTEGVPHIIYNDYDWNCFAYSVNNGTNYSGKFVKLNSDISVSTMAGASETNSFQGTFLGGGHTITAAITDNINGGAAPFRYIKNATIKNLTVAGTITSNQRHMSGLVGFADSEGEGKNLIEGCTVTATLNINTDYAGGIIGHGSSSATTIRGCVFAGTMNASGNPNVGVIWGWSDSSTPALENCLEAGTYTGISKLHPMGLQGGSGTIDNCYYVTPQIGSPSHACTVSGAKQAYAFVSAPPNLGNLEHNYGTMTVYENGILFDGIYYVASTPISLADNSNNSAIISNSDGYLANVTLQGRTLYMDGAWNTLCLPFSVDDFTGTSLECAIVKTLASTDFSDGTLTMNFTDNQTSIEAGKPYLVKWEVTDLSTLTADYTAHDGEVLTGTLGGNYKISIAAGATVILLDVTINGTNSESYKWAGISCIGDATIILRGTNNVQGFYHTYPGIYIPSGSTLTIKGSGSLNARNNGYAAGIGGGLQINCGNIVIEGGTINATGKTAASIGGGRAADCGYITITNGVTKVTVNSNSDVVYSNIGKGPAGSCGIVTIGGNVGEIYDRNYTYTGTGSGSVDMSVNPVFKNVTLSNAPANVETGYVDFVGCYSPVSIYTDEKTNLYLGADNTLYYPTATDFQVNACRGYFQLKLGVSEVKAFNINFGDGETTGIISVHDSGFMVNGSDVWYTLDGRKLDGKPTRAGVYINNGKKTIIK